MVDDAQARRALAFLMEHRQILGRALKVYVELTDVQASGSERVAKTTSPTRTEAPFDMADVDSLTGDEVFERTPDGDIQIVDPTPETYMDIAEALRNDAVRAREVAGELDDLLDGPEAP